MVTGYNMARNLQAKLPSSDTLRIYDINPDSIERFANETKALGSGAAVQVAATVREAAEDSVSFLMGILVDPTLPAFPCFNK
jgi:ornithine cyclodeaminase/alanine dehydrogenase-like protein (mu-crystallin family)